MIDTAVVGRCNLMELFGRISAIYGGLPLGTLVGKGNNEGCLLDARCGSAGGPAWQGLAGLGTERRQKSAERGKQKERDTLHLL